MFWIQLQIITAFLREKMSIWRSNKLIWGEVRQLRVISEWGQGLRRGFLIDEGKKRRPREKGSWMLCLGMV